MIRNDLQYRVTKSQVDKFEAALRELRENPPSRLQKDRKLRTLYEAGIESQLEDLREELSEYENLARGKVALQLKSFDDLPNVLVQARIAVGMSQKDLAQRMSLKEQQIQRYESTEYASASFARIKEVALALGLHLKNAVVVEPSVAKRSKESSNADRSKAKVSRKPTTAVGKAKSHRVTTAKRAAAVKKPPIRPAAKAR